MVYVAAPGPLWKGGGERGLYKTTDGGKTWTQVLTLDEDTGCIDLALAPDDPETVYASAWQVRRDGFSGGNPAEMPFEQPTRFEMAINNKVARTIGLTVPPSVFVRADEVIE